METTDYVNLRHRWRGMLDRCSNPSNIGYEHYGDRGIQVCEDWHDFLNFAVWARDNGWHKSLHLDRIDNDKGYAPDNCRWVTATQNNRNTRKNNKLTAFGETKCISEWVLDSRCTIKATNLARRILKGWTPELAITTPRQTGGDQTYGASSRYVHAFGITQTANEWTRDTRCVVSAALLRKRLLAGWSEEQALITPSRKG